MRWNIKSVIDNIQTLNVVIPSPPSIAFTLHHSCCSKHLPPQVVASLLAGLLMLMPLMLEQYSMVGAYCGTHFMLFFFHKLTTPKTVNAT